MARHINREDVLKKSFFMEGHQVVSYVDILTIPTVEVVRCKDCKHKIEEPLGVWCDVWCMHIMVGGNGFCCYGENRGA